MNDQLHIGMTPSHPGQIVREEVLEELGLSVSKAAELLGVRRATLSDLVHEKAALSPEMALRLEKAFGLSMDMMLRIQSWYGASMMRARADEIEVEAYIPAARRSDHKAEL